MVRYRLSFFYIGKKKQLETALEQFPEKDQVEIEFKSFELDPHAPAQVDYDVHDMLVKKYGMSRSQAMAMNEQVKQAGKEKGIDFQFDPLVLTNTFDVIDWRNMLVKWGKAILSWENCFKHILQMESMLVIVKPFYKLQKKQVLMRRKYSKFLGSEAFADHVRKDEQEARQLGINAVPFFLINDKYSVAGAQPADTFLRALENSLDRGSSSSRESVCQFI
ncbi:DSBA oxidoreductase [Bacillus safensis]|uniref:DSBA oxidoreductase n=1 Tax=Bacillus safensis TaxID=561879 RepID=A0A5S9MDH2_BACIA|nr:DSBA oxidoreductase [Bacillus safensis]